MPKSAAAICLFAVLSVAPALADTVYLNNGEVFEDVVAVVEDDRLRLRLEFGELELPRAWLLRVERSEDGLRGFLAARAVLDRNRPEEASAWLDLALAARAEGLARGYREALLVAADLQPLLDGLAAEMHRIDWVLDRDTERWRPRPPAARSVASRRPPEEPATLRRSPPEAERPVFRPMVRGDDVERTLARTLETLAKAELARAQGDRELRYAAVPAPMPLVPILAIAVGGWSSEEVLPATAGARRVPDGARVPGSLLGVGGGRQPGSLLAPTAARPDSRR